MRPKTIAVLVFLVAAAAAIVIPTVRKQRAESAAAERQALDIEIGNYYEQTVKPLLASKTDEPDHVVGKLLPVVVRDNIQLGDTAYHGSALDPSLYAELDPAMRIDRLAGAGTLVLVVAEGSALYTGGAGASSVRSGVRVVLFDVTTKTVLGWRDIPSTEPPKETNQAGLDNYAAQGAAIVAAYLKRLPHISI